MERWTFLFNENTRNKQRAGDIRTVAFVVENDEYKIRYFDWRKERGLTKQRLLETKK